MSQSKRDPAFSCSKSKKPGQAVGSLSKGWYRVDDQLVMVKGNSITELEQLDMSPIQRSWHH